MAESIGSIPGGSSGGARYQPPAQQSPPPQPRSPQQSPVSPMHQPPQELQPRLGHPGRYATSSETDTTSQMLRQVGYGAATYNTDQARARVYEQRKSLQEFFLREPDIIASLQQELGIDLDEMDDKTLSSLATIVGAPGLSADEVFRAVEEQFQASWAENIMEEYNSGGLLFDHERGNFLEQMGESFGRLSRKRRIWNSLSTEKRTYLVKNYDMQSPIPFTSYNTGKDASGIPEQVAVAGYDLLEGAAMAPWQVVRSVIGVFEGSWRATNRLYRGKVKLQDELSGSGELPIAEGDERNNPIGRAFGSAMDAIAGGGDRYANDYAATFASLGAYAGQAATWVDAVSDALFNPAQARRSWIAGGKDGEGAMLASQVDRTTKTYQLGPDETELTVAIATEMDSSAFGSPLYEYDMESGTFLSKIGKTIAAYGDSGAATDMAATKEVEAINANYMAAVDEVLMQRIPGTSMEAAQARSVMRLYLANQKTIRLASADLAMTGKISFGRMTAMRMGNIPGTPEFQRAAGVADVFSNVFLDLSVGAGKLKAANRIAHGIRNADSVNTPGRIQDVYDGIRYMPNKPGNKFVEVPGLGRGFRRVIDDVSGAVADNMDARLNLGAEDVNVGGINAGFDRIARRQPRFVDNFGDITEYVHTRIQEIDASADTTELSAAERSIRRLTKIDEDGRRVLDLDNGGKQVVGQLIVDWMKTEEGINAIVNGKLGGVTSKVPTIPTESMLGSGLKGIKRGAALTIDKIDDVPSRVARRMAERGAFDQYGVDVVRSVVKDLQDTKSLKSDEADEILKTLENVEDGNLPQQTRVQLRRVLNDRIKTLQNLSDDGQRIAEAESWQNLYILSAKLDKPQPFRQIGLNATAMLGQTTIPKMIHAIAVARSPDLGMAKRAGYAVGALGWSIPNFVNGLARNLAVNSPSGRMVFAEKSASAFIRNYTALLPNDVRARMANMYSSAATEADRFAITRHIVLETMDMLGLPYTAAGRKFMARNVKMLDAVHGARYSAGSATNFIQKPNGQMVASAIRDNDLADSMNMPNFKELQRLSQRMNWWDNMFPTNWISTGFNNKTMDVLIGGIWSPSILWRLGFGIRTTADEMIMHTARDGVLGGLRSRVVMSSMSERQLIPYMARFDRFLLRWTMRAGAGVADKVGFMPGGRSMSARLASALDMPADQIKAINRSAHMKADAPGAENARRSLTNAMRAANPYEMLSMGIMGSFIRELDGLKKLPFIRAAEGDGNKALELFVDLQRKAAANRKGFFEWGPAKIREMVRLAEAAISPDDLTRNARLMMVHSSDVSPHLHNREKLLAAGAGTNYHNQYGDLVEEPSAFASGTRRPDPDSRFHDLVREGWEVMVRQNHPTDEYLETLVDRWTFDLQSDFMRATLDAMLDDELKLGSKLETHEMTYAEFREAWHAEVLRRFDEDPEMMETFVQRLDRSHQTKDGRVAVGRTQEEFDAVAKMSGSLAARTQWLEGYLDLRKAGTPLSELPQAPKAVEHIGQTARRVLEKRLEDQNWHVNWEEGDSGGLRLGNTNYETKRITVYRAEIDKNWERIVEYMTERNMYLEREGILPDDWDAAKYASPYFHKMSQDAGEDIFTTYEWLERNGGADALAEKVYWHEVAHAMLHADESTRVTDAMAREIQAEEFALTIIGAPIQPRDWVYDLLIEEEVVKPFAVKQSPERLHEELAQSLGGIPGMIDKWDQPDEIAKGLNRMAQQFENVLHNTSFNTGDELTDVIARTRELQRVMSDAGFGADSIQMLFQQMAHDGIYAALRAGDEPDTMLRLAIDSLENFFNNQGARVSEVPGPGGFPVTPEVLVAVNDYARHLSSAVSNVRKVLNNATGRMDIKTITNAQDFLDEVDDVILREIMRRAAWGDVEGIDADILEEARRVVGDTRMENLRHNSRGNDDFRSADYELEDIPADTNTSVFQRQGAWTDMVRLAEELASGRVVSPRVVLKDHVETLLDVAEEGWFSSADSIADDIARGDYQSPPGVQMWIVGRDSSGEVTDLTQATSELMKSARLDTELLEASEDIGEALAAAKSGRIKPFLKPISSWMRRDLIPHVEEAIQDIVAKAGYDGGESVYAEYEHFAQYVPETFDDFLKYATLVQAQNGGIDQFVADVLDAIALHPNPEVKALEPALERLIRGGGRDAHGQKRLFTSLDEIKEMRQRHARGEELLEEDQLRHLAFRPSLLPERTYRPYETRQHRLWLNEAMEAGFSSVLTPVIDYFNRDPLHLTYYSEGVERMKGVYLGNRPDVAAVLDVIWDSDRRLAKHGAQRTRWNRNGYVSAKEVKQDLKTVLVKASMEEQNAGMIPAHDNPVIQKMLTEEIISHRVRDTATGRWLIDELLPIMVDQIPPLIYRNEVKSTQFQPIHGPDVSDGMWQYWHSTLHALDEGPPNENVIQFEDLWRSDSDAEVTVPSVVVTHYDEFGKMDGVLEFLDDPEVSSLNLVVRPDARGKGIARKMVEEANEMGFPMEQMAGQSTFTEMGAALANRLAAKETEDIEGLTSYLKRALGTVEEAELHLNDAGATHAMTKLGTFTDNASTATLFSSKMRNVFPFYWAEERFIKRMVQTAVYNPAGFHRALLTFRGLAQSTVLDEDENGNKVFAYPLTDMSYALISKIIEGGNPHSLAFRIPEEVATVKGRWDYAIPVQLDSGAPQSPVHLLGIAARALASWFPGMEELLRPVMGEFARNENTSNVEMLAPPWVRRTMAAMDPDEVRALYADKTIAAMAFMHNNGMTPAPDADDDEVEDYLVALHNWTEVLAWQTVAYGFLGISSPQIEVAEGDPQWQWRNYMSRFGFNSGIENFMRDYPDTTLFTLFETETVGGAPIPATEQVYDFLTTHESVAEGFSESFGYLIPTPEYTSEFYGPAWAKQQKLGLRRPRHGEGNDWIKNVYYEMAFQAAAPEYYAMKDQVEEAKELHRNDPDMRRELDINFSKFKRQHEREHPLFARELALFDSSTSRRIDVMRQLRSLDQRAKEGDEEIKAVLDNNLRARLTMDLLRAYDDYDLNREEVGHYKFKKATIVYEANRQAFVEYGESLVREYPNELTSLWHRIILPEITGVSADDAKNTLIGLEDS